MKTLSLALSLMVFSSAAFSANVAEWADIELYQTLELKQDISFPGVIDFKTGAKFEVLDTMPSAGGLVYYAIHSVKCDNPDLTADMILVNPSPEETKIDRSVGVALDEGCDLDIWVEGRDYYTQSLFNFESTLR